MAGARQPIELVKSKGKKHLTKAEIQAREETEIKAPSDEIMAPAYLTASQAKEFDKISEQLIDVGILTNLDCDVLARFIIASELYNIFTKKLFNKDTQEDIFELEKVSNLQDRYFKQCLSASKELGLTISSRCKLVAPKAKEEKPVNPFLKCKSG